MSHLDEGVLHAMLDGEIGSAELKAIEAHLAGCATCAARLEEARGFRDESLAMIMALDEQPALMLAVASPSVPMIAGPRPGPSLRKRRPAWVPALAWAATIVAAVGLGWSLRISDLPAPPAEPDAAPAPLAEPPAAVAAPMETAKRSAPPNEKVRAARDLKDQPPARQAGVEASAPPPAPAPKPAAVPAQNEALGKLEARASVKATRLAPASAAADQLIVSERPEAEPTSISAAKAIEILGGSIRLVDGLAPVRYESAGDIVRVVYETSFGRLVLEQWRAANVVSHRLIAPRTAPADSVSAWAERVR